MDKKSTNNNNKNDKQNDRIDFADEINMDKTNNKNSK